MPISVVHAAGHSLAVSRVPFAGHNSNISASKGSVTQGIQNRIDGRIQVAQCIEKVPKLLGNVSLVPRSQRFQQYQDVVWRPCDYKREENRWKCKMFEVKKMAVIEDV